MKKTAPLYFVVFAAGFSSMSIELASVRALAPFFGSSVFVWTNLIGIILAALALGYFFGGKLADRWKSLKPLAWTLIAGGILTTLSPLLVPSFATLLIPANLRLEDAFPVLWGGSLFCGLVLFGIPAFLISFTSPVAIRFLSTEDTAIGTISGKVFALSTLGSILGTFLTTYLFVPWWGTRVTFLVAGGLILLVGVLILGFLANTKQNSKLMLGLGFAVLWPSGIGVVSQGLLIKKTTPEETLLVERETDYQYVQILKKNDQTWLKVNEGLDSYQSLWVDGSIFTGGYYDYFLLSPLLAEKNKGEELKVLIIGLAGGTASRQFEELYSNHYRLKIDGIEIDSKLVEAAAEPFHLSIGFQPHLKIYSGIDGRVFLRSSKEKYDVILVDAYAGQVQIPFHLASAEFFQLAKERLNLGGILAMNVSALNREDLVLLSLANTLNSVFKKVQGLRVRGARNEVLFARNQSELPEWKKLHDSKLFPPMQLLLGYAAFPGIARDYVSNPAFPVLTDDKSAIDLYQTASLLKGSRP